MCVRVRFSFLSFAYEMVVEKWMERYKRPAILLSDRKKRVVVVVVENDRKMHKGNRMVTQEAISDGFLVVVAASGGLMA